MEILPPILEPKSAFAQLTLARQSFVDGCAVHGDPWRAYKAVFPSSSDDSARKMAALWARDPLVRAAIAERMGSIMRENRITGERVINEIGHMAFSNLRHYIDLDENGIPRWNFNKVSDDQWSAVKKFTIDEDYDEIGTVVTNRKVTLELHDKGGALDKLMKRLGLYAPQTLEIVDRRGADGQKQITVAVSATEAAAMYAETLRGEL